MKRVLTLFTAALLGATLFAGGIAVHALAGHQPGNVLSITGCVTSTGKLVKVKVGDVPKQPCGGATEVHLSGGDITAVLAAAGGGLVGGGTNGALALGLEDGFKLPQGCSVGAVAKRSGPLSWACGQDNDTQYDGRDFALSNQSCPAGALVTGIDPLGGLFCSRSITSLSGQYRVDVSDFAPEGIRMRTPGGDLTVYEFGSGILRVESSDELTIHPASGHTLELGDPNSQIGVLGTRVSLGAHGCPNGAARRADPVVVNTQNGVGSIVAASTKVFAC